MEHEVAVGIEIGFDSKQCKGSSVGGSLIRVGYGSYIPAEE